MKTVPKYVKKMLDKRYKLAMDLINVCADVDNYLDKLGILYDDEIADAIGSGVLIYCEPEVARNVVLEKIKETLNEVKKDV